MTDLIDTAVNLVKSKASKLGSTSKTTAINAATESISSSIANNSTLNKLKKLPITKDPDLVKQQANAEVQKLVGEKQNELQQVKETQVEEAKDKIAKLAPLAIAGVGIFTKLPILDPKVLATIEFLKKQKQLREEKQKISKENLKKAKENFTYQIKPTTKSE